MIRILHLTDFHLDNRILDDWNQFYKEAFFNKIEELQAERKIDLVLFTGDMIDKAGKDFGSVKNGLEVFRQNIIEPILKKIDLDISRFVLCPGNHDIDRNADEEIDENGINTTLVSTEKVIDFIKKVDSNNSYKRIERIKEYKDFEKDLYKEIQNKDQSTFKFSLKVEINGKNVGISSLNSSWRCYGENDFKNILIGETQLNNNYLFIKECDIKIALVHHQLDWLKDFDKKIITSHIHKNYDLVLSGHVHESMSSMVTGFTGSCFRNVSPSGLNQIRTDSKTFSNGFTVIDYDDTVYCHYLIYNHKQQCFVDNTDVVDGGKETYYKRKVEAENELSIYREAIVNIKEDHYAIMDSHFIQGKNEETPTTVKSAFVYPPIDDGKSFYEEKQTNTTFNDILNSPDHFLFLGPQEIGKKSLLYRIIVEYIEEFEIYNKVPVFIDFQEIKNKEFITIIKEYTRLSTEKVRVLLERGKFILFIDNLNYHESRNFGAQINRLHKLHKDYPLIRFIASYEYDNLDVLPTEIINHSKIPFTFHYIRGLKTREIKEIMKQWLPNHDELKNEESLEKLVKTFSSYHLPNNAISIHLYLWSVENSDRKPINQAVLMEIYVELILEKLNKENIYRRNFDFTNKVQLISMIAEKIIKKENNSNCLSYSEFYDSISEYIKNKVGFTYDINVIINYLLDHKIFIKNNQNEVRFSHLCFMHFFVAKRMQDNPDFKAYILNEERYFNYPREIDYYTGLVRSDKETFILLYERFKSVFYPMDFILEDVNPDEYFNIVIKDNSDEEIEPIARNIEIAKIKDSRPTNEFIEKKYDEQLDKISKNKPEIKGKKSIDFDRMMLIMCNVLRNSEGIEDLSLKKNAYNDIVKHNLTYSILYTQVIIRYIIENKTLPPSVPANISLDGLLKNIPYNIQNALFTHLGTHKLSSVILSKMNDDVSGGLSTKTELERFLSISLYSDIYGDEFDVYLRKFIKSVNTVPTQNYLLFKLTAYLYKRSKEGSRNEELYLDLISDLKIRSQKLPKRLKEQIIKDLKERKARMSKFMGLN